MRIFFFFGRIYCAAATELYKVYKVYVYKVYDDHYQDVVSWNNIVNARLKGDTLTFNVRKHTSWREKYDVSLSYISKKEELLDDIKALCEAKNIPFEIHSDQTDLLPFSGQER